MFLNRLSENEIMMQRVFRKDKELFERTEQCNYSIFLTVNFDCINLVWSDLMYRPRIRNV